MWLKNERRQGYLSTVRTDQEKRLKLKEESNFPASYNQSTIYSRLQVTSGSALKLRSHALLMKTAHLSSTIGGGVGGLFTLPLQMAQ